MKNQIAISKWGEYNGQDILLYKLKNDNNVEVTIINFGATIQSIIVPDGDGNFDDVTFGYDDLQGYIDDPFYIGAVVGRFANRIDGGNVNIDGNMFQLSVKEQGFHQHGGKEGFNKKVWKAKSFTNTNNMGITLTYLSPDGEEGFPGNLQTEVTYTLNNQNQIIVDFSAMSDAATLINLTQHAYFNLSGQDNDTILDHELTLPLTQYLPVNNKQVPTGELAQVAGTPFDFTSPHAIGERIKENNEQLIMSLGYDHTFVIKTQNNDQLKLAARVRQPQNKRVLNVFTTEPGVHLYTGNVLNGNSKGKANASYPVHSALCLETQHFPNSPNYAHFPSTLLKANKKFKSKTIFEFSIDNS